MCFTVTLRVSNLWSSRYSEYQDLLYKIIEQKQKSGMGYLKIACWLNENAYKTIKRHEFKNTHAFSILKKKKLRDNRLNNFHKFEIENMHIIMLVTPMILENKNENL